jgi:signal transduction histidine kinase
MAKIIEENIARIDIYIALCTSNLTKERYVLTLRMNKHEHSHISTLLNDSMDSNFSENGKVFINSRPEKRKLVLEDMRSTIQLITYMENSVGVVIGSIKPESIEDEKDTIDVFDSLYKWRIMFRHKLQQENLDILVPRRGDPKPCFFPQNCEDAPRDIVTVPRLFELLVYNLVDNAVKYAHRGSKIYLSWHRSTSSRCGELSISSFGPEVPEGDKIYGLYERGNAETSASVGGDGIGLFVVKQVQELLRFEKVSHRSIPVEERYNLPLIEWYVKELFFDLPSRSLQEELRAYSCNTTAFNLEDIVNRDITSCISERNLTQHYLNECITEGTWLTTFTVRIPYNNG